MMPHRGARFLLNGCGLVVVIVLAVAAWIAWPLPASLLTPSAGDVGVTIADRNGLVLRSTRAADGSQARWVSYDRIDVDLVNAFVAVEDRRFWEHGGIDARASVRAAKDNLRARRVVSGASTITMQLARLLHPASRSWGGKVAQVLWALRLERHLGKQQIIEQYLNRVELGQGTVGVGAATALYFGTTASDVSVGQAATIAGLAHAPSRENPYAAPGSARRRRERVLRRMESLGYASAADIARARQEPLVAARRSPPFQAPHFTTRVLAWLGDSSVSPTGDAPLRTSIDLTLQTELEAEVRHTVDVLKDLAVEQAAAVVLDNETGEVLAWVGSPDFWSPDDGQTDMVVSPRQPGSSLKPFLYGLAFDRGGFTASTVLPDIPKSYPSATGTYQPRNYDRRFRGPVRAREALASSYNVPAVELASRVGTGAFLHTLQLAGFESLRRDAEYYGLGLALGNGDVTLIELANAYRALANGGVWRPWTWHPMPRARASDAGGRRVISRLSSAIVLDILSDASARIPGFGLSTPFDFPIPVAVKTGTSRHFTDNWAVGATRGFTVAVWAGNFSGRTMQGVSGVTGAGPLLHRAIMATARRYQAGVLTTPAEAGAVKVAVCRLSGLRATQSCAQLGEWFAPGTEPKTADDWEHDGRVMLPVEYADWTRQGLGPLVSDMSPSSARNTRSLPADARPVADSASERANQFRILSPLDGDRYAFPPGVEARYATIPLRAGGPGANRVRWSIDGRTYSGERWSLVLGPHVVRATSEATGEVAEARIVVAR